MPPGTTGGLPRRRSGVRKCLGGAHLEGAQWRRLLLARDADAEFGQIGPEFALAGQARKTYGDNSSLFTTWPVTSALFRRRRRAKLVSRIVELQLALARAERALHHDDLTALLNRRGFRRACDQHPEQAPVVLSCAMIDLDDFKAINDSRGHPAGDAALLHFAGALRRGLRPEDTVARLGGDEFALLLAGAAGRDVENIVSRIQHDLQQNSCTMLTETLRFSAGIAERTPWESLAQTLSRADIALLDAKRRGKSCIVRATEPTP